MDLATPFGERLRARRLALRKTLREVADAAGISVGYLSQVERCERNPSPENQASLAQVLNLNPEELLGDQSLLRESRAFFKTRRRRCSNTLRAESGFHRFYHLLKECSIACSAPGTFHLAGQFNGTNGGIEILAKTPCRTIVGLKQGGPGGLAFEKRVIYNPTDDTFQAVRFQGDPASLWAEHHENLVAALVGKKEPDTAIRNFCEAHSFIGVSETPHNRGWDMAGAQAACMATTLAIALDAINPETLQSWQSMSSERLLEDKAFQRVARLAMKIQSMNHATASGGATAVCPMVGNTVNPIVYASESRDGRYQPTAGGADDRCTTSSDERIRYPRSVGTHFEIYDKIDWHFSRLEELLGDQGGLSLEETLDFGLLYPGDPDPPAARILSVAGKKDDLAALATRMRARFNNLTENDADRYRFHRLLRHDDPRRRLSTCYTDPIQVNAMEVLDALADVMRWGHSRQVLDRLYSAVNRNHWLGWNLGIELPVTNEIWGYLQRKVRRLDHAPGIGATVAGCERGGDVFFLCRWHGLRDLMPDILAELRKVTGERVELDYASWIDGFERDGLRVEDPEAICAPNADREED
jgi:transcriptional regulator with XRE-family HTH domain